MSKGGIINNNVRSQPTFEALRLGDGALGPCRPPCTPNLPSALGAGGRLAAAGLMDPTLFLSGAAVRDRARWITRGDLAPAAGSAVVAGPIGYAWGPFRPRVAAASALGGDLESNAPKLLERLSRRMGERSWVLLSFVLASVR